MGLGEGMGRMRLTTTGPKNLHDDFLDESGAAVSLENDVHHTCQVISGSSIRLATRRSTDPAPTLQTDHAFRVNRSASFSLTPRDDGTSYAWAETLPAVLVIAESA